MYSRFVYVVLSKLCFYETDLCNLAFSKITKLNCILVDVAFCKSYLYKKELIYCLIFLQHVLSAEHINKKKGEGF